MTEKDSLSLTMKTLDAFTAQRDWGQFHSVKNLMNSISIEAAELNETIQWTNPDAAEVKQNPELVEEISDEIADVMAYCLRLCSVLGIEPIAAINAKIFKNESKYPAERVRGSPAKYTSYEN